MSDQIKFGAELSKGVHRAMQVEAATRGMKLKDVYESAVSAWVADKDGVAGDLLNAYYTGSAGTQKELRSVLSEYRKQREKTAKADQSSKPEQGAAKGSSRNAKSA